MSEKKKIGESIFATETDVNRSKRKTIWEERWETE